MSEKIRLTAQEKPRVPDPDRQNAVRFCPKCGKEIPLDRSACLFCGNTGAIPYPARPRRRKVILIGSIVIIFLFLLALALFLTRNTGLV
ncbi:MAG: hypothetical protein IJI57_14470 [Flexilinea sp.]|nr:hypothetical protein [Flexilinea sp.]